MSELPKTGNKIIDLSFAFALKIVAYTEKLEELRKYVISNQLLKSGTSVGANVREAQNCESKADFIHKFKIAAKEAYRAGFIYKPEIKDFGPSESLLKFKVYNLKDSLFDDFNPKAYRSRPFLTAWKL